MKIPHLCVNRIIKKPFSKKNSVGLPGMMQFQNAFNPPYKLNDFIKYAPFVMLLFGVSQLLGFLAATLWHILEEFSLHLYC